MKYAGLRNERKPVCEKIWIRYNPRSAVNIWFKILYGSVINMLGSASIPRPPVNEPKYPPKYVVPVISGITMKIAITNQVIPIIDVLKPINNFFWKMKIKIPKKSTNNDTSSLTNSDSTINNQYSLKFLWRKK